MQRDLPCTRLSALMRRVSLSFFQSKPSCSAECCSFCRYFHEALQEKVSWMSDVCWLLSQMLLLSTSLHHLLLLSVYEERWLERSAIVENCAHVFQLLPMSLMFLWINHKDHVRSSRFCRSNNLTATLIRVSISLFEDKEFHISQVIRSERGGAI